jgi:type VI secretion system protein ImpH
MEAMARFGWRTAASVIDWLQAEPFKFEFFQAVRLLERDHVDSEDVGDASSPDTEPVYFSSYVSHGFPPSDVVDVDLKESAASTYRGGRRTGKIYTKRTLAALDQPQVSVSFMGLAGLQGPLPDPVTDAVIDRVSRRDYAFRDFLDIFNNRLVALLFKSKRRHRLALSNSPPWRHPFASYLFALTGMATPGLQDRMAVGDRSLLKYAPLFALANRSAHGLERMLSDFLGTTVRVSQFQGGWIKFEDNQITKLGRVGQNHRLGLDTVLGTRIWSQSAGIEIEVGPLDFAQFNEMLPGGSGFRSSQSLAQLYLRDRYDMRFRLRLKSADLPSIKLGKNGAARLGWSSWLSTGLTCKDDRQVCFSALPRITRTAFAKTTPLVLGAENE